MIKVSRVFVVGLGVSVPAHMTREAIEVLSECDRFFTLVQEAPELWLPPSRRNAPVTNLMDMYAEGAMRLDNYRRVIECIWAASRDGVAVAYVTYGNPLTYDSVAQRLASDAEANGVELRIVPAISSIDTLLCDLRMDMAPGIQVVEASWLVATGMTLNTMLPAILVQLGAFGSLRAHYRTPPPSSVLKPLEEYLCRTYPPSHQVALVRSGNRHAPAKVRRVALGELSRVDSDDFLGASMFIPLLIHAKMNPAIVDQMARS